MQDGLFDNPDIEDSIGMCLSGGGFRATLFHLGSLHLLNHHGLLSNIDRISSVSGGSITAGVLGLRWQQLQWDAGSGVATNFNELIAHPLQELCRRRVDWYAIGLGLLPLVRGSKRLASRYDKFLFSGATLQDLPDSPRFVFNATNMGSGKLWRFSKPYAADYRIGRIDAPDFRLADAVAASSAFPPVLSPFELDLSHHQVLPMDGTDLHRPPFTRKARLTDGGVYDNLGTEAAWKRCKTVLVSNAGKPLADSPAPVRWWHKQALRVNGLIHAQSEDLRVRILRHLYETGKRKGAYWGLDEEIAPFPDGLLDTTRGDFERGAKVRTRLNPFSDDEQHLLIRLGFVATAHALREQYDPALPIPTRLP